MHWKRLLPVIVDALLANLAAVTGLPPYHDGRLPGESMRLYALAAPVHTLLVLLVRPWKMRSRIWRHAVVPTALSLVQSLGAAYVVLFTVNLVLRAGAESVMGVGRP